MDQNYIIVMTTVPAKPVTTPDGERPVAEIIADGLLKQQLAACVSTLGPTTSRYWWKNQLETANEQVLLIKTKASLSSDVQQFIKEHHPYEVPEIIAFNIADGNEDYLTWIGSCCRYSPRAQKEERDLRK